MEENQKKESFRKKAELLLHHLKPAASAFALGIGASLAATLLRTLFTQIIRFTVDHALLGETEGLPAFLLNAPAGQILVWCAAAAAGVALLEFGAGFVQDSNLPKGSERFVKSLRRRALRPYPAPAVPLACAKPDGRYHPALHLRRGGCAQFYRGTDGRAASARRSSLSSIWLRCSR